MTASPAQATAAVARGRTYGLTLTFEQAEAAIVAAQSALDAGQSPVLAVNAAAAVLYPVDERVDDNVGPLYERTVNILLAARGAQPTDEDGRADLDVLPLQMRRTR